MQWDDSICSWAQKADPTVVGVPRKDTSPALAQGEGSLYGVT